MCVKCHKRFDLLSHYVDVVDDKLAVKVINETNDTSSDEYEKWEMVFGSLLALRNFLHKYISKMGNRRVVESNGEMALYFADDDPKKQPNRKALEFHKAACLIWRMAGGAEPDEDYCSDDEDVDPVVDTAALRKRFNLPAHYSSATLNQDSSSMAISQF